METECVLQCILTVNWNTAIVLQVPSLVLYSYLLFIFFSLLSLDMTANKFQRWTQNVYIIVIVVWFWFRFNLMIEMFRWYLLHNNKYLWRFIFTSNIHCLILTFYYFNIHIYFSVCVMCTFYDQWANNSNQM